MKSNPFFSKLGLFIVFFITTLVFSNKIDGQELIQMSPWNKSLIKSVSVDNSTGGLGLKIELTNATHLRIDYLTEEGGTPYYNPVAYVISSDGYVYVPYLYSRRFRISATFEFANSGQENIIHRYDEVTFVLSY